MGNAIGVIGGVMGNAIGVMGNKITTRLTNHTANDMEIREFRGLITDTNSYIRMTAVKAGEYTDIDATNYGGNINQGGLPSKLMIFCNESYLKSRSSTEVVLPGQGFIDSKTVTIESDTVAEDRNVVNYKVTFEPRDASASPTHFKVFSDSFKTKWRISEQQVEEEKLKVEQEKLKVERLKAQLAEVNNQLSEANAAMTDAEAELKKLRDEEKEKLKAADAKGYEADIQRAAMEYKAAEGGDDGATGADGQGDVAAT